MIAVQALEQSFGFRLRRSASDNFWVKKVLNSRHAFQTECNCTECCISFISCVTLSCQTDPGEQVVITFHSGVQCLISCRVELHGH